MIMSEPEARGPANLRATEWRQPLACHAGRRMKILSRALFLLFVLLGVLIAVSNTQPVQLTLWPLPHVIVMPLYLLVVLLLLLGVLAGLGLGWWAAPPPSPARARSERRGGAARPRDAAPAPGRSPPHRQPRQPAVPRRAIKRRSNARAPWSRPNCRRQPRAAPSHEDPFGRRGRRRPRRPGADRPARRAVPRRLRDAAAPSSHHRPADRARVGRRLCC